MDQAGCQQLQMIARTQFLFAANWRKKKRAAYLTVY